MSQDVKQIKNAQASDAETQLTSAVGANNIKWITPLKLYNWLIYTLTLQWIFTNTTDSTSTNTGGVVFNGGIGVAKTATVQNLSVSALSGSGGRFTVVDSAGNVSAPYSVITPLVVTGPTISLLTTETNWNESGQYVGAAISTENQMTSYTPPTGPWWYWFYDSTTPIRVSRSGLLHLKGTSSTPSVSMGTGAGAATAITISGNDIVFRLTFTTGATPAMNSSIATITFNRPYSTGPSSFPIAGNAISAAILPNIFTTETTTAITFGISGTLTANATYVFKFLIAN